MVSNDRITFILVVVVSIVVSMPPSTSISTSRACFIQTVSAFSTGSLSTRGTRIRSRSRVGFSTGSTSTGTGTGTSYSSTSRINTFRYVSSSPLSAGADVDVDAASGAASGAASIKEQKQNELLHCSKLSLAPMMEYTDRHFRKLVSLISTNTLCYTEMVAANALVHERMDSKKKAIDMNHMENIMDMDMDMDMDVMYQRRNIDNKKLDIEEYGYDMTYIRRFLGQYNPNQNPNPNQKQTKHNPTVLQLGGSDPSMLEEATNIVSEVTNRGYCDYTAINLNCGCPSPKVAGKGNFGASLMNDPKLVRDIVTSMDQGVEGKMPITVKCRIGTDDLFNELYDQSFNAVNYQSIDEEKEYANLYKFIDTVASSGVVTDFQIHARIAVLNKNYSPSDNRKIPTLKYHYVHRLVQDFPELTFSLNGGVNTLSGVVQELEDCPGMAGVMVGRAWAANPWSFAMADNLLYGASSSSSSNSYSNSITDDKKPKNRLEILEEYGKYADEEEEHWDPVKIRRFLIKAITPLFAGEPNGKRYRIALDEIAGLPKKQQRLALQKGESGIGLSVPVSELIMNAAMDHLSEEILLRTPEESYERLLASSTKSKSFSSSDGRSNEGQSSQLIKDWQDERKGKEEDTRGVCGAT